MCVVKYKLYGVERRNPTKVKHVHFFLSFHLPLAFMLSMFNVVCEKWCINQSINVYSSKQPTGFSNRWRLAEPLVEHITIGAGVDMHKQENIIYRDYAWWVQEPQTDLQTHPEPMEINSAKENREKDPKQPAGRNHCTQPLPWQPIALCPLLQGTQGKENNK